MRTVIHAELAPIAAIAITVSSRNPCETVNAAVLTIPGSQADRVKLPTVCISVPR